VAAGTGAPGADAVVDADEVGGREDGIVTVCGTSDELAIYERGAGAVVGGQGVGEGARGWGEEGWWKGARGALCVEGVAG
jgi:hypothetical protein